MDPKAAYEQIKYLSAELEKAINGGVGVDDLMYYIEDIDVAVNGLQMWFAGGKRSIPHKYELAISKAIKLIDSLDS